MSTADGSTATSFAPKRFLALALAIGAALFAPIDSSAQRRGPDGRAVRLPAEGTVERLPASAKRYALVIGVDQYEDRQITALKGAGNDARALTKALVAYAGFPADQVFTLTSESAERPTRRGILGRLSKLRGVVPPDGLLLVAFSGHGIERGGRGYLLPVDAEASNDIDLLEQTAVSLDVIRDAIRKTGVKQVLMLVDACRNDPVAGRGDTDAPMTAGFSRAFNFDVRNREVQAFATVYATAVGERAYENARTGQGYFSETVIEAFAGKAANARGEVTLSALVSYLQTTVPRRIALDLGAGRAQKPFATIEGYRADELVIAAAAPALAPVVAGPGPGAGSVDPKQVELAYWNAIATSTDAEDFQGYLRKYPNGDFAEIATSKVRRLAPAKPEEPASEPARPTGSPSGARPQTAGSSVDLGNGVLLETVLIPAGSFDMGSENGRSDEQPVHRVTIREPFAMGKYEVTQAQWEAVMGSNPSKFKGASLPVEQVSWEDVRLFVSELNARTGDGGGRLPTEAEWEYACRAGTTGDYAGSLVGMGWYDGNAGGTTHAVGQKQPNAWGLYDMHGNVWEWCGDWYGGYTSGATTDPRGASTGSDRVIRGGGWLYAAANCRSANRGIDAPGYRIDDLGFRLVRTVRR